MSVAVMKTKAELSFAESFDRVQDRLPGSPAVKQVRRSAANKFAELGLPHRRIEEWKYTDLRSAVKDALPVRVGDATQMTIADVIVALGPLAKLETHRVVFVNGRYRKELSSPDQLAGLEFEDLSSVLSSGDENAAGLASLNA